MNDTFKNATGLAHNLRNRPTWKQLWDSEDPRDRDACFDGEEGIDYAATSNIVFLNPKEAAKAAQPNGGRPSHQQQQNIKPAPELEKKYIQQQQTLKLQM